MTDSHGRTDPPISLGRPSRSERIHKEKFHAEICAPSTCKHIPIKSPRWDLWLNSIKRIGIFRIPLMGRHVVRLGHRPAHHFRPDQTKVKGPTVESMKSFKPYRAAAAIYHLSAASVVNRSERREFPAEYWNVWKFPRFSRLFRRIVDGLQNEKQSEIRRNSKFSTV